VSVRASLFLVIAVLAGVGVSARAAPAPPSQGAGSNFTASDYAEGLKDTPAILARSGVACAVRQALFAGESTLLDGNGRAVGHARTYEVACEEGLGYLLSVRGKDPPVVFDCIAAGQNGKIACMLPLNSHPAGGLDPFLKAAGVRCEALRARLIGQDLERKIRRYEVACGNGGGYLLDIPLADGSGPAPSATPCFEDESACRFTPHAENVAMLAFKVGKSFGEGCRIGDARYVGHVAARNTELYEVSCQNHGGQLIEVDQLGGLRSDSDCATVKLVGAACQLQPVDKVDPLIARAEAAGVGSESPVRITKPDWVRKPTGEQFAGFYPMTAQLRRINGHAVLNCHVSLTGSLVDCFVVDESPAGFGFGAAAVKMSAFFLMRPMSENGIPVAGAQVNIPINWVMR
jgi:TonB family protein